MCRSAKQHPPNGLRCGEKDSPEHQKERNAQVNARRRERYQERKAEAGQETSTTSVVSLLTEQQKSYFEKSVAKDAKGSPIPLYHGSSNEFSSFDPARLGKGNDSWGNGFYFTDQKHIAAGYAEESNSPTANVKEFYMDLKKPIMMDGKKEMSLNSVEFTLTQSLRMLKDHPDAYLQPNDDGDNMNPLGDYNPKFWDKDEWTKPEMDSMWAETAREYFFSPSWVEMESHYGTDYGSNYLHAVHKETGYDGVIVDFGEDGKHYVAWFPEQMKLTSNESPTDDANF